MIHVRPFRAWRPAPHTAHLVGSRSFLTYSARQLREKLAGNPYSFLHIIHPEHGRNEQSRGEQFDEVRDMFGDFLHKGILQREEQPAFYVYEQSSANCTSRGLIGAVSVDDYLEGRVKKHEQTLTAREELFTEYLAHTGINAEPILLADPAGSALGALLDTLASGPVLYDFSTTDQVRHRFWRVDAPQQVEALQKHFSGTDALYIADGHHRCASSARLAEKTGAYGPDPKAWFMAFTVPVQDLHIHNYDRAVKGLNGLSEEDFLEKLRKLGQLAPLPNGPSQPEPGTVQIRTRAGWHALTFPNTHGLSPADKLDAARLNNVVLGPLLGITDLRTAPRVRFVPGTRPITELERMVTEGKADAAFHLRPVSFAELAAVADAGECMPPKTTWIEPKLRSGLTIYPLGDQ